MITPLVLGRGRAGQAIAKSFATLAVLHPEWEIRPARWIERGASLAELARLVPGPVLAIANPHGLHARAILDADAAGISHVLCEKPACVSLEEAERLKGIRATVAVLHGYRLMWGPQSIRRMIDAGELGELITIEGKYWQASAADRALGPAKGPSWKDEPALSGTSDTLLDLATHWADLVAFLMKSPPLRALGTRSYVNAESPHRDTHVQLLLQYPGNRFAMGSVSKTVHGATNQLEVTALGSRRSVAWSFLAPDELVVGEGRARRVLTRTDELTGSLQPPFHATGWLEGYIEICRQLVREMRLGERGNFPRLDESLPVLEQLLRMQPLA